MILSRTMSADSQEITRRLSEVISFEGIWEQTTLLSILTACFCEFVHLFHPIVLTFDSNICRCCFQDALFSYVSCIPQLPSRVGVAYEFNIERRDFNVGQPSYSLLVLP